MIPLLCRPPVNQMTRVANLKMDDEGQITGTIALGFAGAGAVEWRHTALRGDDESLRHSLQTYLEEMVPKSLEVKVDTIEHLQDYEQPLAVNYQVHGRLGTATGKRLILPSDLFEAGSSATFSDEKRVQAVYFHYPHYMEDALRINLPERYSVEAVPATAKFGLPQEEIYSFSVVGDTGGFTTRRAHAVDELFVLPKDYDGLRKYYTQFESKDQESVVLKVVPAAAAATGN